MLWRGSSTSDFCAEAFGVAMSCRKASQCIWQRLTSTSNTLHDNPVSSRVNTLGYRFWEWSVADGSCYFSTRSTTWNNLEPSWTILNLQHLRPWSHILWPQCGAGCQWCSTSQNTQPAWAGCVASVPHGKKHPISGSQRSQNHPATSCNQLTRSPGISCARLACASGRP